MADPPSRARTKAPMSQSIPSDAPPRAGASSSTRPARRAWLLVPVGLVFLGVLVGAHAYLVQRLVVAPAVPPPFAGWLVAIVCALGATLLLQPVAERLFPVRVERLVVWPASLWMGIAFLLLVGLLASDGALLLLGAAGGVEPVTAARVRAAGLVALTLPVAAVALRQGLARPMVVRIETTLPRWPEALDGFRIVQISDIHFGPILGEPFAVWLRDRVNGLAPDLIAITGDLVDGTVDKVGHAVAPLGGLRARHGRYFVTGNHDHYSGARGWAGRVADLGITVLRNEHRVIDVDGARFVLAGVDDHRSRQMPGEGGEDLDAALADVAGDLPTILLAHDPTTFRRASRRRVDLQLSGHTHGGQIWPFRYLVRLAMPWVDGLHRVGGSTLYVSRGTGFWGPPMRLGAPAEITEIVLRAPAASAGRRDGAAPARA
jgi:predicted MPP superfamily phosphohydrolase